MGHPRLTQRALGRAEKRCRYRHRPLWRRPTAHRPRPRLCPRRSGARGHLTPYGSSVHGQVRSTRDTGERGVVKKNFRYGHDRDNLAHVSTTHLLEAFAEILAQCRIMLRPGATVVVTTRPWRERGELIDLPSAVLAAGKAAGLTPSERCVALLAGIRESQLVSRPSFFQMKNVRDARRQGIPLSVIQHEDVLIFTRPG